MTSVTFLGTGNYLAPDDRYWNSFVIDGTVLVEPSPTALPHLRRCGLSARDIEVVVVSHFHPDHTFGWPFLLLEIAQAAPRRPLVVVGPPSVASFLRGMMELASVRNVHDAAHAGVDIRYVEVDGSWQRAGSLTFRAVEVDHVPHLRCFGYLFDLGRKLAYSGDTQLCAGLEELAREADTLILECNGRHAWPGHMNLESVKALRERTPNVDIVLTHVDDDVGASVIEGVRIANTFDVIDV